VAAQVEGERQAIGVLLEDVEARIEQIRACATRLDRYARELQEIRARISREARP